MKGVWQNTRQEHENNMYKCDLCLYKCANCVRVPSQMIFISISHYCHSFFTCLSPGSRPRPQGCSHICSYVFHLVFIFLVSSILYVFHICPVWYKSYPVNELPITSEVFVYTPLFFLEHCSPDGRSRRSGHGDTPVADAHCNWQVSFFAASWVNDAPSASKLSPYI